MLPVDATLVVKLCLLAHRHLGELAGMVDLALMQQHNGLLHAGWRVAWSQFQGLVQVLHGTLKVATLALKRTQCTCRSTIQSQSETCLLNSKTNMQSSSYRRIAETDVPYSTTRCSHHEQVVIIDVVRCVADEAYDTCFEAC